MATVLNAFQKAYVRHAVAQEIERRDGAAALYDKDREEHYNLISALHKSMRGSDPDAALYWLARMLDGGADPLYCVRRMIRMATEDIGLADPAAAGIAMTGRGGSLMLVECKAGRTVTPAMGSSPTPRIPSELRSSHTEPDTVLGVLAL